MKKNQCYCSLLFRRYVSDFEMSVLYPCVQGLSVELSFINLPVFGETISFLVTVTNCDSVLKTVRENVNAQAKQYYHSPSNTFWEDSNIIQLAPHGSMCLCKCVEFMLI